MSSTVVIPRVETSQRAPRKYAVVVYFGPEFDFFNNFCVVPLTWLNTTEKTVIWSKDKKRIKHLEKLVEDVKPPPTKNVDLFAYNAYSKTDNYEEALQRAEDLESGKVGLKELPSDMEKRSHKKRVIMEEPVSSISQKEKNQTQREEGIVPRPSAQKGNQPTHSKSKKGGGSQELSSNRPSSKGQTVSTRITTKHQQSKNGPSQARAYTAVKGNTSQASTKEVSTQERESSVNGASRSQQSNSKQSLPRCNESLPTKGPHPSTSGLTQISQRGGTSVSDREFDEEDFEALSSSSSSSSSFHDSSATMIGQGSQKGQKSSHDDEVVDGSDNHDARRFMVDRILLAKLRQSHDDLDKRLAKVEKISVEINAKMDRLLSAKDGDSPVQHGHRELNESVANFEFPEPVKEFDELKNLESNLHDGHFAARYENGLKILAYGDGYKTFILSMINLIIDRVSYEGKFVYEGNTRQRNVQSRI